MNVILLSGGSGKRLWPLSNDVRSKQFIRIFKGRDGSYESMFQRMYRGIREVCPDAKITIATSKTQVSGINNQLAEIFPGEEANLSVEPCRRDTFPAIALASLYLKDVMGASPDEPVVVCPVDPYVENDYFKALKKLSDTTESMDSNLVLMGIDPSYPSAKYGYIIPESKDEVSRVSEFKEKPDEETAAEYISRGALWNGGVFAYRLRFVTDRTKEILGYDNYYKFREEYSEAKKISFDYAVVENESDISVVRFSGSWKDLGTWNTLTEAMEENVVGSGVLSDSCENVHIVNNLDIPIFCMGIKDAVVSASPDGILVSDKHESSYIKPYVDKFDARVMFAEKSWGSYRVIDAEDESLTIKVTLNKGHKMYYHSHERRDESWNVILGRGKVMLDGKEWEVGPGDVVQIPAGAKHTITALSELQLIEVQFGKDIDVNDKIKYD